MKSSIFSVGFLASLVLADSCNHDNLLRCMISNSVIATPYCSSYLSIPIVTSTVSTVTPLATSIATVSLTTLSTTTTSTTATITTSTTTTTYAGQQAPPKRGLELEARAGISTPGCLTQVSSTLYPASRISSACLCLSVTASTLLVTATAPTATSTTYTSVTAISTIVDVVSTTTTAIDVIQTCTISEYPNLDFVVATNYYSTGNCVNSFEGTVLATTPNCCALTSTYGMMGIDSYEEDNGCAPYFYTDTACIQGQSEEFPADYECYDVSSYQSFQNLCERQKVEGKRKGCRREKSNIC